MRCFARSQPGWSKAATALALLALVALTACTKPSHVYPSPPIIVVDIDTLRADHLGAYGYPRETSPRIDEFAANAVRFEWAFAQAPNTPPSQASILTGLYPSRHGRIGNTQIISDVVKTWAEALKEVGYETAAFVDGGLMASGFGLERGFSVYDDRAGGVAKIGPRVTEWLADRGETPFFLLVHTYDVHSPYEDSPASHKALFTEGLPRPSDPFQNSMSGTMAEVWESEKSDAPRQLSEVELAWATAMYDSGIRVVDDWFGELEAQLRSLGIWDQAIVILLSDHGDEFQEHGSLFHEKLYAPVTRVPLIVKLPGSAPPRVVDTVVETIDVMPTALELVQAPVPEGIDGKSFVPLLQGERLAGRQIAMSESPFFGRRVAITARSFRLFYTVSTRTSELYEFRRDPLEQEELGEQQAAVRSRLERAAWRWHKEMKRSRRESNEAEALRPETIEQLRALGYIR